VAEPRIKAGGEEKEDVMWRWIGILAGLALAASMTSCIVHAHNGVVHGVEVVLPVAHVCDARCGHYQSHGRWYYYRGHVHGPGCGHVFVSGVWRVD